MTLLDVSGVMAPHRVHGVGPVVDDGDDSLSTSPLWAIIGRCSDDDGADVAASGGDSLRMCPQRPRVVSRGARVTLTQVGVDTIIVRDRVGGTLDAPVIGSIVRTVVVAP